jgi:hypothetical protein
MPQLVNVPQDDSFEEWRVKTNTIATQVGELDDLTTAANTNLVDAINETKQFSLAIAIALS